MILGSAVQFDNALRVLIDAELDRMIENLSHGTSVTDYASYRHEIGRISGLRKALDLCDESASELNRR